MEKLNIVDMFCDGSKCVLSRHCKDTHFIFCGSFRES